tara:strand:+ start:1163 stop:1873 length:711 start_codon:yes stop_codon:yes gene_type:complete
MSRKIHLSNSAKRDATIIMKFMKPDPSPKMGVPGQVVKFRRYIASTEKGLHDSLVSQSGEEYADLLINDDPEVDIEEVGKTLSSISSIFLNSQGEVIYAAPKIVEIIINPDGTERERRDPVELEANVQEEYPINWSGKKMPIGEAIRKFVFRRTLQLIHVDGLTYDFLFNMAKELSDAESMMLVGGGPKGSDPLVFQTNGKPYRAFLEGRIKDKKYQLLMHLSDMELKAPRENKGK